MQKILAFLLLFIVLLVGCASTTSSGIVNADRKQFMVVSSKNLENKSRLAYAKIIDEADKKNILNTDQNQTNRVREISKRLISQVGIFRKDALNWDWQVNVINSNEINAWCMPGGKIAVYSGLIEKLNLNDAELAAILGHEMAHALREHSRESASREMVKNAGVLTLGIIGEIFGISNVGGVANLAADVTISLPFSRDNEKEADEIGAELMARSGYNPKSAVDVWKKMSAFSKNAPFWLSTHPSSKDRANNLAKVAIKLEPIYLNSKKF